MAIVIVGVPLTVLAATGRLWWRSGHYSVTVNDAPEKRATVYVGQDAILVDLRAAGDESYLIYPRYQEMGRAQDNNFLRLPFCVVSLQKPAIYIPISKLIESPTHEEFGPASVKFLTVRHKLVVVHW